MEAWRKHATANHGVLIQLAPRLSSCSVPRRLSRKCARCACVADCSQLARVDCGREPLVVGSCRNRRAPSAAAAAAAARHESSARPDQIGSVLRHRLSAVAPALCCGTGSVLWHRPYAGAKIRFLPAIMSSRVFRSGCLTRYSKEHSTTIMAAAAASSASSASPTLGEQKAAVTKLFANVKDKDGKPFDVRQTDETSGQPSFVTCTLTDVTKIAAPGLAGSLDEQIMEKLGTALPQLVALDLQQHLLTGKVSLVSLPAQLCVLNLNVRQPSDKFTVLLDTTTLPRTLTWFNIGKCDLDSSSVFKWEPFSEMSSLDTLWLGGVAFSAAPWGTVGPDFAKLPRALRQLSLDSCNWLSGFANLSGLSAGLTNLNLGGTKMSFTGNIFTFPVNISDLSDYAKSSFPRVDIGGVTVPGAKFIELCSRVQEQVK